MGVPCRQPSDRLCCDEELGRKLAVAELEVLHLKEFLKQVTQKYTEDIQKLEEKVTHIINIIYTKTERKTVNRTTILSDPTNDQRNKNIPPIPYEEHCLSNCFV